MKKIGPLELVKEVYYGWREWFLSATLKLSKNSELETQIDFDVDRFAFGAKVCYIHKHSFLISLYCGPALFIIGIEERWEEDLDNGL